MSHPSPISIYPISCQEVLFPSLLYITHCMGYTSIVLCTCTCSGDVQYLPLTEGKSVMFTITTVSDLHMIKTSTLCVLRLAVIIYMYMYTLYTCIVRITCTVYFTCTCTHCIYTVFSCKMYFTCTCSYCNSTTYKIRSHDH